LVPLDSQFFQRAFDQRLKEAMHSFVRRSPHRSDAVRAGFMPGSSALALNLRAFSIRDEGNRMGPRTSSLLTAKPALVTGCSRTPLSFLIATGDRES
jgi:hypothetical protein